MLNWFFKKNDKSSDGPVHPDIAPDVRDDDMPATERAEGVGTRMGTVDRQAWRTLKKELLAAPDIWDQEADDVIKGENDLAKERLVELIKESGHGGMVPSLVALSGGHPQKIRQKAVEALGNFTTSEAAACLKQRAGDEDPEIRWRSVYALGYMKAADAYDLFVNALDDEVTDVRWRAVWALNRLDEKKAVPHLIRMLGDGFSGVRGAAAEALGDQQAGEGVPALINALGDKDQGVVWSVIEALGKLKASAAVPALTQITETGDPDLQTAAQAALEQIGGV